MNALEQLKGDLRFVRAAVDRADRHVPSTAIYFLWAVVGFCGFALVDFAGRWVPFLLEHRGPYRISGERVHWMASRRSSWTDDDC